MLSMRHRPDRRRERRGLCHKLCGLDSSDATRTYSEEFSKRAGTRFREV